MHGLPATRRNPRIPGFEEWLVEEDSDITKLERNGGQYRFLIGGGGEEDRFGEIFDLDEQIDRVFSLSIETKFRDHRAKVLADFVGVFDGIPCPNEDSCSRSPRC